VLDRMTSKDNVTATLSNSTFSLRPNSSVFSLNSI
jgi:hypothetical protein